MSEISTGAFASNTQRQGRSAAAAATRAVEARQISAASPNLHGLLCSLFLGGGLLCLVLALRQAFVPADGMGQHLFAPFGIVLMALSLRAAGHSLPSNSY